METKHLHFIDDEPDILTVLRISFRNFESDYKVDFSESVDEFETKLKKIPQDEFLIIITDLNLPNRDGFELIRQGQKIRQSDNTVYYILSAYDQGEYIDKAKELGVTGYFKKPVNIDQIKNEIMNLFSVHESK